MNSSNDPRLCKDGKNCKVKKCWGRHPCFHCGEFGHRVQKCNRIAELIPCGHEHCINHLTSRMEKRLVGCGGVGTLVVKEHGDSWVILGGMERWGDKSRQGKYNLFTGRVDQQDNNCIEAAVIRELREESKIHAKIDHRFHHKGDLCIQYFGGTPVLLMVADDVNVPFLNLCIGVHNGNPNTPDSEREIMRVEWITLDGKMLATGEKAQCTPLFNIVRKALYRQWKKGGSD